MWFFRSYVVRIFCWAPCTKLETGNLLMMNTKIKLNHQSNQFVLVESTNMLCVFRIYWVKALHSGFRGKPPFLDFVSPKLNSTSRMLVILSYSTELILEQRNLNASLRITNIQFALYMLSTVCSMKCGKMMISSWVKSTKDYKRQRARDEKVSNILVESKAGKTLCAMYSSHSIKSAKWKNETKLSYYMLYASHFCRLNYH